MPSLTLQQLIEIIPYYQSYPIFVETGTYLGHTIFEMDKYFEELHTVEIKKEFYESAKNSYQGSKITFHLGDSINELSKIVCKLSNNTIFFLDGHWSSEQTGRGIKDVPLLEELQQIMKDFKHQGIIIIDDYRLFGKNPIDGSCNEDWSEINDQVIIDICADRIEKNVLIGDRLVLFIN